MRYLLSNPINTLPVLQERQQHILRYQNHPQSREILKILSQMFDLHKVLTTIIYKKLTPVPFIKLRNSLAAFFAPHTPHQSILQQELQELGITPVESQQLFTLWELLYQALKKDDEINIEMDFIQDGYHPEVDALRKIAYHSDELLLEYQQFLVKSLGINNIKLKYIMNQ